MPDLTFGETLFRYEIRGGGRFGSRSSEPYSHPRTCYRATSEDKVPVRCWECDEPTDEPVTVTLRTIRNAAATLTLCTRCYRTCYFPLAADRPDGTLLIEPDGTDSGDL